MAEVSFIICTYNREEFKKKILQSLRSQLADPSLFEILIVDNNSSDQTAELSKNFLKENPSLEARYILEKSQGLSHARNRGIDESKGSIISFIDDDVWVFDDFAENVSKSFKNPFIQAIGGRIIPKYESEKAPVWMSKYLLPSVSALDMGDQPKECKGNKLPIGANMSFRKDVFETYGGFNTELGRSGEGLEGGEEKDMFFRIRNDEKRIVYAPTVQLRHFIPDSRVTIDYIKRLATGVGTSEMKRIKDLGFGSKLEKYLNEGVKVAGTLVLFALYLLSMRPKAALMLIKFRVWVLSGMMK